MEMTTCAIPSIYYIQQVVYITATAPYIFLTVMLVRGLTLDGSLDGIKYYVTPDFEKISHYEVSKLLKTP